MSSPITDEEQSAIWTPSRLAYALDACLSCHQCSFSNLAILPVSNVELCTCPRHVGMVPLHPAELLTIRTKLRMWVEISAMYDRMRCFLCDIDGDDRVLNTGGVMVFSDSENPLITGRMDIEVGIIDLRIGIRKTVRFASFWREGEDALRLPVRKDQLTGRAHCKSSSSVFIYTSPRAVFHR